MADDSINKEIERLAYSLKNSGVASSLMDAMNKAKEILNVSEKSNINIAPQKNDKKAKVDEIIKEVEEEIQIKKAEKAPQIIKDDKLSQEDLSKFNDPSFNIANTDMTVKEIVKAEEIFTNDKETLEKEKEAEKMEHEEDKIDNDQAQPKEEAQDKPVSEDIDNIEDSSDSEEEIFIEDTPA